MQKKFLNNLFLVVFLNLLVKPFFILGIDAEVQNRVGEAVYGNYFSILNFTFLLNIFLDLGISNYNTRDIAQNPYLLKKNFHKILPLRFLLFLLYFCFTVFIAFIIGYTSKEFYLLLFLLVNQFFVSIIYYVRSNFAGLLLFKTDSFISVLDRVLLIFICSVLLWSSLFGGEFKIEWFVYAQTLSYGITACIALVLLLRKVGSFRFQFKFDFSKVLIKKSLPYALLVLLMMMYNRIDAVMLERLLDDGDYQAGIYAQGFRFLDAVNMFALLFASLLLPIFSRLIKNRESVTPILELSFRMLFGVSAIVSIVAFYFQSDLIALRYTDSTPESATSFGLLILSFMPVSITYIFGTLLTANGSLAQLNKMAFLGLVINISLNLFLIPHLGAVGAASSTLITQFVTALIQVFLVYRIFLLSPNNRLFFKLSLLVTYLFLFGYFYFKTNLNQIGFGFGIPLMLISSILVAFILRVFRFSDFTLFSKNV